LVRDIGASLPKPAAAEDASAVGNAEDALDDRLQLRRIIDLGDPDVCR
jgi:hypothetical protein